jgi:hypothetical protein
MLANAKRTDGGNIVYQALGILSNCRCVACRRFRRNRHLTRLLYAYIANAAIHLTKVDYPGHA